MNLHPLQSSFSAGEISPLMIGRTDLEGYKNGLEKLRNMLPNARGPVRARSGMRYISRWSGNDGRIKHVQITDKEYYIMLFRNLRLEINTAQGALPGANLITNPTFTDGSTGWTVNVSTGSVTNFLPYDCTLSPYQPSDSTLTNPDFNLNGLGWTVRQSHVQSVVTFAGGICTMAPRIRVIEYAGIAQDSYTSFPGEVHTVRIIKESGCAEMELRIGTAEADGSYLTQTVPVGEGTVSYTFTPGAEDFWVTLDTPSLGAEVYGIISELDVAEPVTGHTAGIAQGVTTTEVGEIHYVQVVSDAQNGKEFRLRLGTALNDGTYLDTQVGQDNFVTTITPTVAGIWITVDANYPDVQPELSIESISINEPKPGLGDYVGFDTPWLEEDLQELQFIGAPTVGVVYIVHKNYPPYKLQYFPLTGAWVLDIVTFTSEPAEWVTGSYPVSGTIFQGRLWLGGPSETFWGSVSASYEDFSLGTGLDGDAVQFTLAQYGAIRWITGYKTLMIGTENSEHIVHSGDRSTTTIITPSDIDVDQQSSYGSAAIQSIQVGDEIFYVSADRRKLRAMQYEWTKDNWLSQDLTFTSEHITEGLIKQMSWVQNPNNILLIVLQNGDAAVLQYDRPNNIFGWSLFETNGTFLDFTSGQYNGFNEVVALSQRLDGAIDLEHYDLDNRVHLDSWEEVFYSDPVTTVTGFDHLEGRVVSVLTDGALHPDRIVEGGGFDIQWPARYITAGLSYSSFLKTLPSDFGAPNGSALAWTKRWNEIFVRVKESTRPLINGTRPADRTPSSLMDLREPNKTEVLHVYDFAADINGQITIEQDLPFDLTVISIFGDMEQDSL